MLENLLTKYPQQEDQLIEILLAYQAQKQHRYINEDEIAQIAKHLGVTESKVFSVVTFYTLLSTKPRGENVIQICKNIPCYVNGEPTIRMTLEKVLGIRVGETTPDMHFTLEETSCLGHCDGAPAMRIGHKTFTNLDTNKVKAILSEYRGAKG